MSASVILPPTRLFALWFWRIIFWGCRPPCYSVIWNLSTPSLPPCALPTQHPSSMKNRAATPFSGILLTPQAPQAAPLFPAHSQIVKLFLFVFFRFPPALTRRRGFFSRDFSFFFFSGVKGGEAARASRLRASGEDKVLYSDFCYLR